MNFILSKTALSKLITNTKRLLEKKDSHANFLLYGDKLSVNFATPHFIFHSNLEVVREFSEQILVQFHTDIRLLEKSLKGLDRGLKFEVSPEFLICEEINLKIPHTKYVSGGKYNDLSGLTFTKYNAASDFFELLTEMYPLFCTNEASYSEFLKITNTDAQIINPELYCIKQKKYIDDLDIDSSVGNKGLSLHRSGIEFFIKTITSNDIINLEYSLIGNLNLLIFRNANEYHCFRFSTDVEYPDLNVFKPSWDGVKVHLNSEFADKIRNMKSYSGAKKIYIHLREGYLDAYLDTDKNEQFSFGIENNSIIDDYCFNLSTLLNVLETFDGDIECFPSNFCKKGSKEVGKLWFFRNGDTSKFLSSYSISKGLVLDEQTKLLHHQQLNSLENEIAILNRKAIID